MYAFLKYIIAITSPAESLFRFSFIDILGFLFLDHFGHEGVGDVAAACFSQYFTSLRLDCYGEGVDISARSFGSL